MKWFTYYMPVTRRTAWSIGWLTAEQERRQLLHRALDLVAQASGPLIAVAS